MTSVLVAGATGMLGSSIARHLLEQDRVQVRLLARQRSARGAKADLLDELTERGATVVIGDLTDPSSLDTATTGVDIVVSAVQGGRDIIVDGQVALASAAVRSGVRRFIPSDFAIDLFAAPDGAPQFDLRKHAAAAIDAMNLEVVHVLNGAFMDMMLDPNTAGIVDLNANIARLWGTGDERFNLTTVDDTARFTAVIATDDAPLAGVRMVSGAETSFNDIVERTEKVTGRTITRQVFGDADDLRRITAAASDNPWSVIREWYFLSMITVPPFAATENDRYPGLHLTSLDEYLTNAYRAHAHAA